VLELTIAPSDCYKEFCRRKGWEPKDGINRTLEKLEDGVILAEFPTGYGKSLITLSIAMSIRNGNPIGERVIHILPMRSIAEELGSRINEWLGGGVAIQYMGSPESPFFSRRPVVVTTLDTFILNFYKSPAHELWKLFRYRKSHFEFPRGNIYSSVLVFDEFHLFSPMGSITEEGKSLTSVITAISLLASSGVPVVITTATMPNSLKELLRDELRSYGVELIELSPDKSERKKLKEERGKKNIFIEAIGYEDLIGVLKRSIEEEKRTMFVSNTVSRAIEIYRHVKSMGPSKILNSDVIILHGRLPKRTREENTLRLRDCKILIATQVVEAGIDVSFDVLITEAAPPDRLVQRLGRLARREEKYGELYIVEPRKTVYDEKIVNEAFNVIQEISNTEKKKIEIEEILIDKMNELYSKYEDLINSEMGFCLRVLDQHPFLGKSQSKKVIETFNGLTDSFGIVSGIDELHLKGNKYEEFIVPITQREASNILKQNKKVVDSNGRVKVLEESEIRRLSKFLSIGMLHSGYIAIVLPRGSVDPELGYGGRKNETVCLQSPVFI